MTLRRNDGLSVAVWENSPWSAFVRFRNSPDADCESEASIVQSQTTSFRRGVSVSRVQNHTDFTEEVRSIFGRALDAARSKKAFVSASSVTNSRKGIMKSEVRLLAEDHCSWGSTRFKSMPYEDTSGIEIDEFTVGQGEDDANTAEEPAESQQQPTESLPGATFQISNFRAVAPTQIKRAALNLSSGAEGTQRRGGLASCLPRTPTRLRTPLTSPRGSGGGLQSPGPSSSVRSLRGALTGNGGGASFSDSVVSNFTSHRAAGVALLAAPPSAKLMHVQAANAHVRYSLDVEANSKKTSPAAAPPPLNRSNSFGTGNSNSPTAVAAPVPAMLSTEAIAAPPPSSALAGHATGATSSALLEDKSVVTTPARNPRAHTVSGCSLAATQHNDGSGTGVYRLGGTCGGGGSSSVASLVLPHTPQRGRSRQGMRVSGEDPWARGPVGGSGSSTDSGQRSASSGLLPDAYNIRVHPGSEPSMTLSRIGALTAPSALIHTVHCPVNLQKHSHNPVVASDADVGGSRGPSISPPNHFNGRSVLARLQSLRLPP